MKRIPILGAAVLGAIGHLALAGPRAASSLLREVHPIQADSREVVAFAPLRTDQSDRFVRGDGKAWLSEQPPQERELQRLEESVDAMGTTYTVIVYGASMARMRVAVGAVFDELRRIDRVLSNYRNDSELSHINRYAAERPVKVTPELYALLSECERYGRESEGTFDITVGPLMKVWGFYRGTGRLASKHQVAQALEQVGYAKVVLNAADGTVRFARPDVEIDLGGIGKGYAVDRMITLIKENGIGSALVNSGGSSIYGLGAPPGQDRGWEVNIRHPKRPSEAAAGMYLKNESISTSGSSEKSFLAEGRSYSHIMDPRTGYPAEGMLEVAVIAPRTQDSEAWTKPYFILGRRWAAQHKPRDSRVFLCEDQAEPQCLWLP